MMVRIYFNLPDTLFGKDFNSAENLIGTLTLWYKLLYCEFRKFMAPLCLELTARSDVNNGKKESFVFRPTLRWLLENLAKYYFATVHLLTMYMCMYVCMYMKRGYLFKDPFGQLTFS